MGEKGAASPVMRAAPALAAAGTVLLCASCGQRTALNGQSGQKTEPVTLDWYINYAWYQTPWGGNLVSDRITQETGVAIRFLTPIGNEEEKFNAMISSDTLPDIITLGWWENAVDTMIDRDMVYALNELADTYDITFWEQADPTVVSWFTREDGNLYCYPNSSYSPEDYEKYENIGSNQTFLVRKDIYEALGRPDMTTPQGFIDAVRRAAEAYPETDGYPLIPVGAHVFNSAGCVSFDQYLQNFLAVPYEKDGVYLDRYTDPDYIVWLKAFRTLGAEGYLKEDIFIDQRIQMEEKLKRGQYFCMLYQRTDLADQQAALYAASPERIYMAVDGPKNSAGDDPVLPGSGLNGWTVTLISKNCKYPDRAIRLFSYLMSDAGQMLTYLGVEGVTYDIKEGRPVVRPQVQRLLQTNRTAYDELYGADNAYWMFQDNARQLEWRQPLMAPNGQLEEWTYPYSHYLGQYEFSFDRGTEAGEADMKVKELWSRVLPKLLLAPTEEAFDSLFADFLAKRDALGYDLVLEESSRQMRELKERLHID